MAIFCGHPFSKLATYIYSLLEPRQLVPACRYSVGLAMQARERGRERIGDTWATDICSYVHAWCLDHVNLYSCSAYQCTSLSCMLYRVKGIVSQYKRWLLLNLNLVYGDLWTNVYAHHNNHAWCKATGARYAIVRLGRKQGTHGAARIPFGWIGTAALWAKGKRILTCTQ